MGVVGPKSKIEEQRLEECHMERRVDDGHKWLDSIEKQKRRIDLKFAVTNRRTDIHTDRQTESTTENNRLLG